MRIVPRFVYRMYIKILYRNNIYGPIKSPATVEFVCQVLKISLRASPTLVSMDRQQQKVIVMPKDQIDGGLWELFATDVPFDPQLDAFPVERPKIIHEPEKPKKQTVIELEPEEETLPLNQTEMQASLKAFTELIASIPPRYIRYNARLSLQIDTCNNQVQEWLKRLEEPLESQVSEDTMRTFIQYRIIHLLHETWKSVWTQFSPYARSFNTSQIHANHSLDVAEGYLNRLWSWRRMLDHRDWTLLQKHFQKEQQSKKTKNLRPPRLPSTEYQTQAYVYLAQRQKPLKDIQKRGSLVDQFRIQYVQEIVSQNVHTNRELDRLLRVLANQKQLEFSKQGQVYPSQQIIDQIRQEFAL